jgi:MFS family permease
VQAFIVGPSIGSLLYGIDPSYPALVASALFIVNIGICLATIPEYLGSQPSKDKDKDLSGAKKSASPGTSFTKDVVSLMQHSSVLIGPLLSLVLITFVERSMKETNILSYFEIRYDMDTKNIGFVSSISAIFAFLANTLLVKPFISFCGGSKERSMVFALMLCALASFLEVICQDIYHYVVLVVPLFMISSSVVMTLSKSVLSCSIPHEHVGKTLAVFGVLESVVGVIAPLYGTHFFTKLGYSSRGWLGGMHYTVAAVFLWAALIHKGGKTHPGETTSEKTDKKEN